MLDKNSREPKNVERAGGVSGLGSEPSEERFESLVLLKIAR